MCALAPRPRVGNGDQPYARGDWLSLLNFMSSTYEGTHKNCRIVFNNIFYFSDLL